MGIAAGLRCTGTALLAVTLLPSPTAVAGNISDESVWMYVRLDDRSLNVLSHRFEDGITISIDAQLDVSVLKDVALSLGT